jgi:hypothetical protein
MYAPFDQLKKLCGLVQNVPVQNVPIQHIVVQHFPVQHASVHHVGFQLRELYLAQTDVTIPL